MAKKKSGKKAKPLSDAPPPPPPPPVEIDPNVPYYKWPPFPEVPEGVVIIPFKDFKPKGLILSIDSDEEELDGEGIATIALGVIHTEKIDKEKRKKKKKKPKTGQGQPDPKVLWYEEWEEMEHLRVVPPYDPMTDRSDRFFQGAHDFHTNRQWSAPLQSLYDHFRIYVGLLSQPVNRRRVRPSGIVDGGDGGGGGAAEADADDELSDEEMFDGDGPAQEDGSPKQTSAKIEEIDDEHYKRIQAEDDARQERLELFFADPEKSMKVFFSSYFRDKGLFWSDAKLRDGPILVEFFLNYFIRNQLLVEYERELNQALQVVQLARAELPMTHPIARAWPDAWGSACKEAWRITAGEGWLESKAKENAEKEWLKEAQAERVAIADLEKEDARSEIEVNGDEWMGVPVPSQEQPGPNVQAAENEESKDASGASGSGAPASAGTGWGPSGEGAPALTGVPDSNDIWGAPIQDWEMLINPGTLFDFLGPTNIINTHDPVHIEDSTRYIVSFVPPSENSPSLLHRKLAVITLAPWRSTSTNDATSVPPPLMLVNERSGFDPTKENIKVFTDPKAIEHLRPGIGLGGLWVHMVNTAEEGSETKEKPTKANEEISDSDWWFVDRVSQVLPSYWTEVF